MAYEELKRDYDNVLDSNEMLKVELKATKDILLETESKLSLATGEIEGYRECLRILSGHDDADCRRCKYGARYMGDGPCCVCNDFCKYEEGTDEQS